MAAVESATVKRNVRYWAIADVRRGGMPNVRLWVASGRRYSKRSSRHSRPIDPRRAASTGVGPKTISAIGSIAPGICNRRWQTALSIRSVPASSFVPDCAFQRLQLRRYRDVRRQPEWLQLEASNQTHDQRQTRGSAALLRAWASAQAAIGVAIRQLPQLGDRGRSAT